MVSFPMSRPDFLVVSSIVGIKQEVGEQWYLGPYGECVLFIAISFVLMVSVMETCIVVLPRSWVYPLIHVCFATRLLRNDI